MTASEVRGRIEDLVHAYAHCIDDDRLEEWPLFFTEDCRYQLISRDNYAAGNPVGIITCDSRGMLEDRIASLRQANIYEPHVYRHLISGVRITGEDAGVYSVDTGYAVIRTLQEGDVSIFSSGKYVDKIVFKDDTPRFQERIAVCDTDRIDTLIVVPI